MAVETRTVEYHHDDTLLEGYLAWDGTAGSPRPTVLIAHMWGGRVPFVCDKAEELAGLGYTAMALDLYGKGVFGKDREENARLSQPFVDDRKLTQTRMQAGLDTARQQPEVDGNRVAAIGYCFGGLCALELARSGAPIAGAVSIHGLLRTADRSVTAESIRARVQILHGECDPMADISALLAVQSELSAAGVDWQTVLYGHAMHAFTNPQANDPDFGTVFDARTDRRSWRAMLDFLDETLAGGETA